MSESNEAALQAEVETLKAHLARAHNVLRTNLSDFKLVNETNGLWRGHPFTHAVDEINAVLEQDAGKRQVERVKELLAGLEEIAEAHPQDVKQIAKETIKAYRLDLAIEREQQTQKRRREEAASLERVINEQRTIS